MSLTRKIVCTLFAFGLLYLSFICVKSVFAPPPHGRIWFGIPMMGGFTGFLGLFLIYDAWLREILRR